MKQAPTILSFDYGEVGVTPGDDFLYHTLPCDFTIIFVSAAPLADDADLTLDINSSTDGDGQIAALACADADVPGTWKSTAMGGTNDPVTLSAGSKISYDFNGAAANTVVHVEVWGFCGTEWS